MVSTRGRLSRLVPRHKSTKTVSGPKYKCNICVLDKYIVHNIYVF